MKYLLGVTVLVLVAVLALQWHDWPPRAEDGSPGGAHPQTESPTVTESPSPLELLEPPLEREEYAAIAERPLFLPDRRPPDDEPEQPEIQEEKPNTELDAMDLTAIVITTEDSVAWVRTPSKQTPEKLRLGDELEGWTLKSIKHDEIELERQGETDTLVLRDYSKSPPAAARPPNRPARPPAAGRGPVRIPASETRRPGRPKPASRSDTKPRPGARQPRSSTNAQRPQKP